jgi:2-methylcitrate dehydratase PrpD
MNVLERVLDLTELPSTEIPASALVMARLSLFDWMVCGLAGIAEPVAKALRAVAAAEAGRPTASVFGGLAVPARMAALVNGATSHALDYDDTHFAHVGHPSVAIYPAALAVGEEIGASAADVADAFLIGAEASVRIGIMLGRGHYNRGFHQTATAGAFGATLAAGRLFGLSRERMRAALGLCATRAAGLKCQFGTMGKPYNAGVAASNGVECALLARAGMTSAEDGIEGPQGFVPTHSDAPDPDAAWENPPPGAFVFEDIKYKLHACCHGTHAMIEALRQVRQSHGASLDNVTAVHLCTNPRWLSVCDIKRPRTGLEVKFSYVWLAGMVLSGLPTSSDRTYGDDLAADPSLAEFARTMVVTGDERVADTRATGRVSFTDGTDIPFAYDLADRIHPETLAQSLRTKAEALIGPKGEELWQALVDLGSVAARDLGRLVRA